jgi:hypothetical protein
VQCVPLGWETVGALMCASRRREPEVSLGEVGSGWPTSKAVVANLEVAGHRVPANRRFATRPALVKHNPYIARNG